MSNVNKEIELIQQVLDTAIQRGIIANLESAAAVWQAWGTLKYKIESADGSSDSN
jgi:hypothetical protein